MPLLDEGLGFRDPKLPEEARGVLAQLEIIGCRVGVIVSSNQQHDEIYTIVMISEIEDNVVQLLEVDI